MSISVESSPLSTEAAAGSIAPQLDRILRSHTFRSCEVLRNLLAFLAASAVGGRLDSLKSKEIATAVFGRTDAFDSQSDSVVRVQTGRLRSKLAEYYVDEGADDDIILNIPKGSYALSWHHRHPVANVSPSTVLAEALPVRPPAPRVDLRRLRALQWIGAVVVLVVFTSTFAFWLGRSTTNGRTSEREGASLATFWQGFLGDNDPPFVVFSNLKLAGTLKDGFHIFREDGIDRDQPVIDSYTTTGEVMGVFDIARTLSAFGKSPRAKNGHLLSWDDARDSNMIFVGGPLADTPLKNLPIFREFQFRDRSAAGRSESGAIVNVHPRPGEASLYAGPISRPFPFDYAVISLRPGFSKSRRVLALAGVTEYGTAGAADFLTRENQVSELLSALKVKTGDTVPWFEALLRVKVEGEVPVQYEVVVVHKVGVS